MKGQGIHWTRWRRAVQIVVVLFYIALPLANIRGFVAINGTLAALRLGRVDLIEPAAGFSAILAGRHVTVVLLAGILPVVMLALVLGPVFCSWICPWGFVSELLAKLRPGRPWSGRPWVRLRRVRLLSLVAWFAASALLAIPLAALFSAPRLITALPLEAIFLRMVSPVTAGMLVLLLMLEILGPRRIWCRAICPAGALANYLRGGRTLTVVVRRQCACPAEPKCIVECEWGVDPRLMRTYDGCTNCMRCIEVCPTGTLRHGFRPGG